MNMFTIFFKQNFSKILSKTHQIASFLKHLSGEHAPEPRSNTKIPGLIIRVYSVHRWA